MTQLKNKVVLITGASSGIGEALVYQIAEKGAKLILAARRETELERVKSACPLGAEVATLPLDLADAGSIAEKAKVAESIYGQVDVLINCGGISQRARAIDSTVDVDRRVMEVNYFGTIALTKALLPGMVQRKSGHQVVVTSAVGIISSPLRSAYAASKHALHGFYDALRAEHFEDNLQVTMVLPGFIKTQISINALTGDGSQQNTMDDAQANGMTAEECARRIIRSIEKNNEEVYIGGMKEVTGIYLKRYFPGLFSRVIRKTKVT